jgi:hypothetical protein
MTAMRMPMAVAPNMWVFLNDAFLSVVQHRDRPGTLLVRSRIEGDIERAIPGADVFTDDTADYMYRAMVSRECFKDAMASAVDRITYGNFKDSIHRADHERKSAYLSVWSAMAQAFGAFGRRPIMRGIHMDELFAGMGDGEPDPDVRLFLHGE